MTRFYLNYVCGFAKQGHCNPGPLPGLDRKGLWSWSALTKPWFQRCDWYISPSFKTLGILGRSIKKCETLAVGVVVLEIPVLFLASTPALPGGEPGPHLPWPWVGGALGELDAGCRGFGYRIHTLPSTKINDKCPRCWCQPILGPPLLHISCYVLTSAGIGQVLLSGSDAMMLVLCWWDSGVLKTSICFCLESNLLMFYFQINKGDYFL